MDSHKHVDRGASARIAEHLARERMLARQRRFLIDPRKSKWLTYWDGVTAVALVYTAIVTPAECALFDAAKSMLEPLFLINRVLDGIFLFDMSIQFRLMVQKIREQYGPAV